jgi:hypothetical protein
MAWRPHEVFSPEGPPGVQIQGLLGDDFLQVLRLAPELLDSSRPRGVPREPAFAGFKKLLRPGIIQALAIFSRRQSSAIELLPRRPSSTMRIFSSAEYCFSVAQRMSRTSFSAATGVGADDGTYHLSDAGSSLAAAGLRLAELRSVSEIPGAVGFPRLLAEEARRSALLGDRGAFPAD